MADLTSPRLRGRAGVERRQRVLAHDPLCQSCKALGLFVPADEVDHVVPLHRGGPDDETNLQGLCFACHEAKTLAEYGGQVSNHPDWLKPSLVPLTILCGPPCSGKSTLARMHASADDLVLDLDDTLRELDPAYHPWTGDRTHLNAAIAIRNRTLGQLSQARSIRQWNAAWFIVAAPSPDERAWWQGKLGGELHLLNPGLEECKRRAHARGTPGAIEGIAEWDRRSREPWSPHRAKVAVDADGWPMDHGGRVDGTPGGEPSC